MTLSPSGSHPIGFSVLKTTKRMLKHSKNNSFRLFFLASATDLVSTSHKNTLLLKKERPLELARMGWRRLGRTLSNTVLMPFWKAIHVCIVAFSSDREKGMMSGDLVHANG